MDPSRIVIYMFNSHPGTGGISKGGYCKYFFYLLKSILATVVSNDSLILLKKFEDWLTSGRKVRYESSYVIKSP